MERLERNGMVTELIINQEWCKGCGICAAFCPGEVIAMGKNGKACRVHEGCSGCGVCEMFCPDFAITLIQRRLA